MFRRVGMIAPWRHRTLAQELSWSLAGAIVFVMLGLGGYNSLVALREDRANLDRKTHELGVAIVDGVRYPLWNLDRAAVEDALRQYARSDIVHALRIEDDQKGVYESVKPGEVERVSEHRFTVDGDHGPIGTLIVTVDESGIARRQRALVVSHLLSTIGVLAATLLMLNYLLRRLLRRPLERMKLGIETIAEGNYAYRMNAVPQCDLDEIVTDVNHMASAIAERESKLCENQKRLERLNDSITEIFSASDPDAIIRVTARRVCELAGASEVMILRQKKAARSGSRSWYCDETVRGSRSRHSVNSGKDHGEVAAQYEFRREGDNSVMLSAVYRSDRGEDSRSIGETLAGIARAAIHRHALVRETAFMETELKLAESIQRSMIVQDTHPGLSCHYQPVARLGGDWYSYFRDKSGENLFLAIGDVTGHGVPQGLVTTAVKGALDSVKFIIQNGDCEGFHSPAAIVRQIDRAMESIAAGSRLGMTCLVARANLRTREINVCNAGHPFPYVIGPDASGQAALRQLVGRRHAILGTADATSETEREYLDDRFTLDATETLLLYTDGLLEAANTEGVPFGRGLARRVRDLSPAMSPDGIKSELLGLYRQHCRGVAQKDDLCLLALHPEAYRDAA